MHEGSGVQGQHPHCAQLYHMECF